MTRVAFIDLGRQLDVSSQPPTETPVAVVYAFNTAIGADNGLKWRADVDPPKVETPFPDPQQDPNAPQNTINEFCELRMLREVTGPGGAPTPADIGDITMGNPSDFPDSISPELTADFTAGAYQIAPTPMNDFLTFSVSVPTEPHFVLVSGTILAGVIISSWPESADFGHHIPFELKPTADTLTRMQGGFQVASPAAQDLVFRYDRIETGNDGFEAVFVRITGQQTELFCEQREGRGFGGEIRVLASILDAFRLAENITAPTTYNLYFERASRELIQPRSTEDQLVLVTVRVRHSLTTPITFQ